MTDRACAICVKRLAIPGRETGLGRLPDILECRAKPPVTDVGGRGSYPQVRPDDYCHSDFEVDRAAAKARGEAGEEQARLDGLVTATQAAPAAQAEPVPPAGGEPEGAPVQSKSRARRARAEGGSGSLL